LRERDRERGRRWRDRERRSGQWPAWAVPAMAHNQGEGDDTRGGEVVEEVW